MKCPPVSDVAWRMMDLCRYGRVALAVATSTSSRVDNARLVWPGAACLGGLAQTVAGLLSSGSDATADHSMGSRDASMIERLIESQIPMPLDLMAKDAAVIGCHPDLTRSILSRSAWLGWAKFPCSAATPRLPNPTAGVVPSEWRDHNRSDRPAFPVGSWLQSDWRFGWFDQSRAILRSSYRCLGQ